MIIENGLYKLPTDEEARRQGCYFDEALPDTIVEFLSNFKIPSDDYSGEAGRDCVLQDWQKSAIYTGYGWRNKDKTLRFKEFSWWLPRRSGKSLLTSLLLTFHCCIKQRAEILLLASTMEQANIVYRYADSFIDTCPELSERFKRNRGTKVLVDTVTNSQAKVVSCEKTGRSGTSTSVLIWDEIHEAPQTYAREVWSRLTPSLGSKVNSLIITISTAGTDRSSLAYDRYLESKKVLSGESDRLDLFPVVYELPIEQDWQNENNWWATMPGAGFTIPKDFVRTEYKKTKDKPVEEVSFRRQFLNQWLGSPEIWIPHNILQACHWSGKEEELYGCEAVYAYDWGASYDLTCAVLMIQKNDLYYLLPRFFIPKEIAEQREKSDHFPYRTAANVKNNNLYLTDGNVVDGEFVVNRLDIDAQNFKIKEVRFDPNKMALVSNLLQSKGYQLIEQSTSAAKMSPLFELFERLLREGKIRYCPSQLANWNFSNARPKRKNDHLSIEKSSLHQKIDFIDAASIALASLIEPDTAPPIDAAYVSVWDFS